MMRGCAEKGFTPFKKIFGKFEKKIVESPRNGTYPG
jgi:hypothetical protein